MAKKLNKMTARIEALEKAVAGFFSTIPAKAKRKTKTAKTPKKSKAAKKATVAKAQKAGRPRKAAKKAFKARKAAASKASMRTLVKKTASPVTAPAPKAKKAGRRKVAPAATPTAGQLAPSSGLKLVGPLDEA